jgi:hypothetical protein
VPAETSAANHRGWYYNSRCYDNWCSRCYDGRGHDYRRRGCHDYRRRGCHDYRRRGCDYDCTSIRETSSVKIRMEARTTSARSAGTVNKDE